jgi:hypothetical protein
MKLWESEGENDCEDRPTEIAEEDGKKGRDGPVLALADNDVEIATELIALSNHVSSDLTLRDS